MLVPLLYVTVAGTTLPEPSLSTKPIVPGWTASLNVAVTAVFVAMPVAFGVGVSSVTSAVQPW